MTSPGIDRERAGVIVGSGALELLLQMACRLQRPVWLNALRDTGVPEPLAQQICDRIAQHYAPWQEATFPGLLANVIAGRIANRLDLHGSQLRRRRRVREFARGAVRGAVNELELGRADLMLVGGVDTFNDITMFTCFSKTPGAVAERRLPSVLRPRGRDDARRGPGVLRPQAARRRRTATVTGSTRCFAGSARPRTVAGTAVYAPAPAGQARALRRAYAQAGYEPRTVELVEGHGTGTPAGDAAEVAALSEVFGPADRPWCALGSAKSQFGHTKSAAGAVGLLKAVLALHHRVLPPTIKVDRPVRRPGLRRRAASTSTHALARGCARRDHPRRASVSSFGFGGSNFHATLEEYVAAWGRASRGVAVHATDRAGPSQRGQG